MWYNEYKKTNVLFEDERGFYMKLSEAAKKAKREYQRKWAKEHREYLTEYAREWRKKNPEKVDASRARYWEKVAAQQEEGETGE